MNHEAFVLEIDGQWFCGFSGLAGDDGKSRVKRHGALDKARLMNSASETNSKLRKLRERGMNPVAFRVVVQPGAVDMDAEAAASSRAWLANRSPA